MNIKKIHLDDMDRCYCASHINIDGIEYALLASEAPNTICNAYSGNDFSNRENVWDDRTGCMSIIPISKKNGEFLAVNNFSLKDQPSTAKLIWTKRIDNDGWISKDLVSLPFLHRFDIFEVDEVYYVICATIAKDKHGKDDWSEAGQIYVGKLPNNLNEGIKLELLADGFYRNHGYSRAMYKGKEVGYFASDNGVFRVVPPYDKEWKIEKVMDGKISEVAFNDLDGDGVDEMITIEPFHGNSIKIYKNNNDKYEQVYEYKNEIDFAHSLVADTICGIKSFICGVRRCDAELFIIQYENNHYKEVLIDKGVGPANISVIHMEDKDCIISANHTKNEAALYEITK